MPGDLRDPEQYIPYHYDNRYEKTLNPFLPGAPDMNGYLQSIALEIMGIKLSPEKLNVLKDELQNKGYFHRNPGDESFRNEVSQQVKRLVMARKVAYRCLI